jgi:hypothetical protein
MNGTFDIFLRKEDGSFEWTGGTETLALARGKVVQNPASVDYVFFIVNEATGEKTLIEPPLISKIETVSCGNTPATGARGTATPLQSL